MNRYCKRTVSRLLVHLLIGAAPGLVFAPVLNAQPDRGALYGEVRDPSGGLITGARVIVATPEGGETAIETGPQGSFLIGGLEPGSVSIRVDLPGFRIYRSESVVVEGETTSLDIRLAILPNAEEITITTTTPPLIAPNTAATLVLDSQALGELPQTPGGLSALLRILGRRSVSASGAEVTVNGFPNGRLPPRESIREIRVSQDPFSAQFGEPGMSRIEILTRPGEDSVHGGVYSLFNDESLNSRNPFLSRRPPFQSRLWGGSLSGPIRRGRAAFFAEYERTETDDNAFVHATILDSGFDPASFVDSIEAPRRADAFDSRLDLQLQDRHTLAARYGYADARSRNEDVGEFSLPSLAARGRLRNHSVQLMATSSVGSALINEIRVQHVHDESERVPETFGPTIRVPESFVGGGSENGRSGSVRTHWDFADHLTWLGNEHSLKLGGEIRRIALGDRSEFNFGGTFVFEGRLAPDLDDSGVPIGGGSQTLVPITNLESYRRTVWLSDRGLDAEEIRDLGGGASQLSMAGGEPEAAVTQYEGAFFVLDDWRLGPGFTLSSGLRVESQNRIGARLDLAPRIGFAWAPGQDPADPKFAIRGGAGIFYDRVPVSLSLEAARFAGSGLRQFFITDPQLLDLYPAVPSIDLLDQFEAPSSLVRMADSIRSPYTMHSSIGIETQLPMNWFLNVTATATRSLHLLRSRNLNAPMLSDLLGEGEASTSRPDPASGEIFQYESTGRSSQRQLTVNLVQYLSERFTHYTTYIWSRKLSDTAGPEDFPASSYDLAAEYGRASNDPRHTLYWGGWFRLPGRLDLTPLVIARSGLPFNITTGRDTNGDGIYTERPALVPAGSLGAVETPFGVFDPDPLAGTPVIERNYALGPAFFTVHLQVARTVSLPGEGHSMTIAVQIQNLFNRLNLSMPVGNLGAPSFGEPQALAGDYGLGINNLGSRRIEVEMSWEF